ncbi:hypothetical protein F0L68_24240 [Solihabitans fulvus]|uniref:Zn-binding Pro-Ala-Ala-Arg (PAAR) domain-containing protein, incolved in TypeVI secretion n=1 Tax=Solihabitans fulvus TaxID=1892852 RepID=A0A5B2X454_9PSEU|nr:PAAR domain-containing protein [Solihabitans fulvus]KAA2258088.1 hypothetical protein F0L68_24240 [Solihabitans fulvus]
MPPVARIGDTTAHAGTLLPPVPPRPGLLAVLVAGRPVAVAGSVHECAPHVELGPANLVLPKPGPGRMVLVCGLPVACVGDQTVCGANIVTGAPNVLLGGLL